MSVRETEQEKRPEPADVLGRHGFRADDRPREGEPVWVRAGQRYGEADARDVCQREARTDGSAA